MLKIKKIKAGGGFEENVSKESSKLDGILIKVRRCLEKVGVTWLIDLFKNISRTNKMLNDRRSISAHYKNKGFILSLNIKE